MSEVKCAMILVGGEKYPTPEYLRFNEKNTTVICGVYDFEEACRVAVKLVEEDGYNLIELCGDFQEPGYQMVKKAVGDNVKVGYVIYPED